MTEAERTMPGRADRSGPRLRLRAGLTDAVDRSERRDRFAERGPGELTVRIEVDAPVADVFAAATDWPRQSDWIALTTVRVVRGDGRAPGSVVDAFTGVGPVGFLDTMEIVRFEPGRRVDVVHSAGWSGVRARSSSRNCRTAVR